MSFEAQQKTQDAAADAGASFFMSHNPGMALPSFKVIDDTLPWFLYDKNGNELAPMPHDELTGLPLCYVPNLDLPPPSTAPINGNRIADWEHLIPRAEVALAINNPVLVDDIGKMALTHSRIQWVDYREHHEIKNRLFKGPMHPQTSEAMTIFLMMAEAGYIPPEGVDFSKESPEIRALTTQERLLLQNSGQVRMACEGFVRKYLFQQILNSSVDHILQETWMRFLAEVDYSKKVFLAHRLAAKMVEQVIEPISGPYVVARDERLLPEHLPKNPADFIKRTIIRSTRHGDAVNVMSHRFGAEKRSLYPELYEEPAVA